MIAEALAARAARHPSRELLRSARRSLTFAEAQQQVERLARELRAGQSLRVGLQGVSADWLLLRLLTLDAIGARACLLPQEPSAHDEDRAEDLGLGFIVRETSAGGSPARPGAPADAPGQVMLFTSGTTGTPKPVLHSWRSLASRVRFDAALGGARWLLTYSLTSFAGLQVALHGLLNGGTLVDGSGGPADAARLAREAGVTHVSATPSFLRLMLSLAEPADLAGLRLAQITLGGEPADQALLDGLRRRFPSARLTQVYASTEMGVCFSVHDGNAGFPASFLENVSVGTLLRIVDGELRIGALPSWSRHTASDGTLFATEDLVERRGDRVVFLGRRDERIEVGGHKAYPAEIEAVVLEAPGVRAVRVSGTPSSLVGRLVRAEIVLDAGGDEAGARRRILAHCRSRLPSHMVPRLVEFVSELARTDSGKLSRR